MGRKPHEALNGAVKRAPFVVEFIGAAGTGKTTLALAVASALREGGTPLSLALSARPRELPCDDGRTSHARALAVRLARGIRGIATRAERSETAERLLSLMPLPPGIARLRRRRYIARLDCQETCETVLLRDQGYLCAVAGLAKDSGRMDRGAILAAVAAVPLPDIAIRLRVPGTVIHERLARRLGAQGWAERMLERSPDDTVAMEAIFDSIEAALMANGCAVVSVSGRDAAGPGIATVAILDAMGGKAAPRKGAQW